MLSLTYSPENKQTSKQKSVACIRVMEAIAVILRRLEFISLETCEEPIKKMHKRKEEQIEMLERVVTENDSSKRISTTSVHSRALSMLLSYEC